MYGIYGTQLHQDYLYSNKALSGKTDKRPQFQKMTRDAEKRQFTVVVAYKSNRIARNMLNAFSYEDRLGRFGMKRFTQKRSSATPLLAGLPSAR